MAHRLARYINNTGCNTLVYTVYQEKDPHKALPPAMHLFGVDPTAEVRLHDIDKKGSLVTTVGEITQWIKDRETKKAADLEQAEALKLPARSDSPGGNVDGAVAADLPPTDAAPPGPLPVSQPVTPVAEHTELGDDHTGLSPFDR